ncbi:MAG: DNA primase [Candidatus Omnitrophica bacterium]|nr:DNA primase [Candidatus Omnitrophota bacterium]
MGLFIPDNIIEQILDKCDIAEIISSYIPLKRAGRNFKASCPFHHEKTPSFVVNPSKGIFHCFGCGVGGNAFSFIMKYEKLEFPEVAKILAKKTGVRLPERPDRNAGAQTSLINRLYGAHEHAAVYFQNALASPAGKRAREYIAKRGLQSETIRKFGLGFALNAWDGLLLYLKRKGFAADTLEKSGLIIKKQEGSGHFDRFRNRLIFPIFDQRDKIIAFAGRVLDDSLPKYMNSPETPIYNKSRILFGLNFARKGIGGKDAAIVVEGYTDLMIPYQDGMDNIVASCGTALTLDHVRLLKRHSRNVIMVYDSDKAGEMATLRGLDVLLSEDMNVAIARLPEGFDPDSYVRKYGIAKFTDALKKPVSLFEYELDLFTAAHGTSSTEAKTKVADEMLKVIGRVNNEILKSEYIKKLGERLDLSEGAIRQESQRLIKDRRTGYGPGPRPLVREAIKPLSEADKILIGLMLEDNSVISLVKEKIGHAEFSNEFAQNIARFIFDFYESNRPVTYAALISHIDADGSENLLSEIGTAQFAAANKEKNLEDCISWIKKDNLKRELDDLRAEIKKAQNAGENSRLTELVSRYNRLIKEKCSNKINV